MYLYSLAVPVFALGTDHRFVCCRQRIDTGHAPDCTDEARRAAIESALRRSGIVSEALSLVPLSTLKDFPKVDLPVAERRTL